MSVHRLARTRFSVGLVSLTAVTAVVWLVLWAAIVPVVRGWSPVAVVSESMAPRIDAGDIVVAAPYDGEPLGAGTVIVFDNPAGAGTVTHRIVDTTPTGDYVTRGDANGRIDSTPVSPEAIRGVGRILVPVIGAPFAWADQGRTAHLLMAAVIGVAALWTSRWALLTRYNPWRNTPPPALHTSITTIGAVLGIWPNPSPPATVSTPPRSATRRQPKTRSPRRLAAVTTSTGLVVSVALLAPVTIRAQAAFTYATDNTTNSWSADTLNPPTSLTAVANGSDIDVDWTATSDTYVTGHRVYRSTTSGGPYTQIAEVTPRSTGTYVDNPTPGTYYYVVRAHYLSWESTDSNEATATLIVTEDFDAVPPGADNCPTAFNVVQYDTDTDGSGDTCDPTPTGPSSATFIDAGQDLGGGKAFELALGDLDSDGDLDAVFASDTDTNRLWINSGTGSFAADQSLGSNSSRGVALGDLDGDGDLDVIFANNTQGNRVWVNNGAGSFTDSAQSLGSAKSHHVALGDVDGDGDLDAVFANHTDTNQLWLNNGTGSFTADQALGTNSSKSVAFGDLDGDGDLDMIFANDGTGDTVWLNNGTGTFTDTGQSLGIGRSHNAVLHDLDGDGDIDIAYAGDNEGDTVWLNNGTGSFTDTGQVLGLGHSRAISVGDLDGDGDPDLIYGSHSGANSVWLNDGTATFNDSAQTLGTGKTEGIALGDLDGDGDLDAITANNGNSNRLWQNN